MCLLTALGLTTGDSVVVLYKELHIIYGPCKILAPQVKELRVMSINIPWLEVLKACYPNAQITEDTEILVVSPQYTADIAVIMSTTDRWVQNSQRTFSFGEVFTITEKAPNRAFSWLKAPTS